jgi:aspartyl-tRNA synthetase
VARAGITATGLGDYSRKQLDELTELAKKYGAKGLAYLAITSAGEQRSSFAKFTHPEILASILEAMGAKTGDLLLFVADNPAVVYEVLGRLRVLLAERLELMIRMCWHFAGDHCPFVIWNGRSLGSSHHLFTSHAGRHPVAGVNRYGHAAMRPGMNN